MPKIYEIYVKDNLKGETEFKPHPNDKRFRIGEEDKEKAERALNATGLIQAMEFKFVEVDEIRMKELESTETLFDKFKKILNIK